MTKPPCAAGGVCLSQTESETIRKLLWTTIRLCYAKISNEELAAVRKVFGVEDPVHQESK